MSRVERAFPINDVMVGGTSPAYVIAEIGVNHNGDITLAKRLIEKAAATGAQAAKLQSFSADRLATSGAPKAPYQLETTDSNETQHAMLKSLELDESAHRELFDFARAQGITLLSTPFDEESADLLDKLGVPAFKISSGDLTHHDLLRHIAAKGKPMLVSTGMADIGEVHAAMSAIAAVRDVPCALLHCVSVYPADPEDANLAAMATLRAAFGVPVGWSDHVSEPCVGWAAVALGAKILEKHITLDKNMVGADHRASADPDEFASYVRGVRQVEAALGDGVKRRTKSEEPIAAAARRSVVTLSAIQAGTIIGREHIGARRPGIGLSPTHLHYVLGRKAAIDIPAGTIVETTMLE